MEDVPNLDDLRLITPQQMGAGLNDMERVGNEVLSGREVIHLRADESMMEGAAAEDVMGLINAENVQFDVWIDLKEGFVLKSQLLAEGKGINAANPDAEGRFLFVLEYYDFNADIEIEAPEDVMTMP